MKKQIKMLIGMLLIVILAISCNLSTNKAEAAKKSTYKLNKTKLTMYEWSTYQLKLEGVEDIYEVSWKTSDYKGLGVGRSKSDLGLLRAYKPGKYTITAKYKKKTYKCKVTVKYQPKGTINGTITSDKDIMADAYLYLIPQNANLPTYTEKQFRYALSGSRKDELDGFTFTKCFPISEGGENKSNFKFTLKEGKYLLVMIGMSSYDNTIPMSNNPKLSEYFGEDNAKTLSEIHRKHRYSIKEIEIKDKDEIMINQKL